MTMEARMSNEPRFIVCPNGPSGHIGGHIGGLVRPPVVQHDETPPALAPQRKRLLDLLTNRFPVRRQAEQERV